MYNNQQQQQQQQQQYGQGQYGQPLYTPPLMHPVPIPASRTAQSSTNNNTSPAPSDTSLHGSHPGISPSPAYSIYSNPTNQGTPQPIYTPAGYQNQYHSPPPPQQNQQQFKDYFPVSTTAQHPYAMTSSSTVPPLGFVPVNVNSNSVSNATNYSFVTPSTTTNINNPFNHATKYQNQASTNYMQQPNNAYMNNNNNFTTNYQQAHPHQNQFQSFTSPSVVTASTTVQQQQQQPNQFVAPPPHQSLAQSFAPSFGGFMNDPTAQIGLQLGSKAINAGQDYVNQNVLNNAIYTHIMLQWYRTSINQDTTNSYSTNHIYGQHPSQGTPSMAQQQSTQPTTQLYRPPREDLLSPDLYIPVMAFVTYVLLIGLELGTRNKFHPREIGMTASTGLILIGLDVFLIQLGCYLFTTTSGSSSSIFTMLELVAYSGYKFVGAIVTTFAAIVLPKYGFWGFLAYTSIATAVFYLRSFKYLIMPESAPVGSLMHGNESANHHLPQPQKKRRMNLLLAIVIFQVAAIWVLVPWSSYYYSNTNLVGGKDTANSTTFSENTPGAH